MQRVARKGLDSVQSLISNQRGALPRPLAPPGRLRVGANKSACAMNTKEAQKVQYPRRRRRAAGGWLFISLLAAAISKNAGGTEWSEREGRESCVFFVGHFSYFIKSFGSEGDEKT
jgi:hypothetical protein